MKSAAQDKGIQKFTGTLFNSGIEWRQENNSNVGYLFMRMYGTYLDEKPAHWVSIKRSRTILLAWAMQARSARIRMKAQKVSAGTMKSFSIRVKPHPFVYSGYRRAIPKLAPMLKGEAQRVVAST
jgi:hypothetical protein